MDDIRIQAVVFDLDDTLYPEHQYVASGYAAVCEHLARRGGIDQAACFDFLLARFLSGQAAGAFNALDETFGPRLADRGIGDLVRVYREHAPTIQPYGGMPDLLGRLRARMGLGLLSDGYLPAQRLKLAALGLERFFDAVVFTEDLGRDAWKPSHKGFELIAERLGARHEACGYVADNPAKDFLGANELGWRTVQYLHPSQVHSNNAAPPGGGPQVVVRTPPQLLAALHEPAMEWARPSRPSPTGG